MKNKELLKKYSYCEIKVLISYIKDLVYFQLKEKFPLINIIDIDLDLNNDDSFFSGNLIIDNKFKTHLNAFKFNIYISNPTIIKKDELNFGILKLSDIYIQNGQGDKSKIFSYKEDIKNIILNIKESFPDKIMINLKTYIDIERFLYLNDSLSSDNFDFFLTYEQDISVHNQTNEHLKEILSYGIKIHYYGKAIIFKTNLEKIFSIKELYKLNKFVTKNNICLNKINSLLKLKIQNYSNNFNLKFYLINEKL